MNKISFQTHFFLIFAFFFLASKVTSREPARQMQTSSTVTWNTPITMSVSSNWGTGLCGNIQYTNPSTALTAQSYIITMRFFNSQITSSWGNLMTASQISSDAVSQTWLFIGRGVSIGPGVTANDIGICMSNGNSFSVAQSIILGIDLKNTPAISCTGLDCVLSCGDGICATCETVTNCPIDCQPNQGFINQTGGGVHIWPATVTYSVYSYWSTSLCANVYVTNPSTTYKGIAHLLSLIMCNKWGTITSFWGYDQQLFSTTSTSSDYHQVGNNIVYGTTAYNVGGFCMTTGSTFSLSTMTQNLQFSADMRDQNYANCNSGTCAAICGDHVCGTGETATNCPVDCAPIVCH